MKTQNTNFEPKWNLSSSLLTSGALLRMGSRRRSQKAARMVAIGILLLGVGLAILASNHWTPIRMVGQMITSVG